MTTARKYIKFGLRADKNLADLTDPGQAVDNLLDDQAVGSNKLGESFTLSSVDILPLRSFAGLDLVDTIDPSNELPKALTDLEGSIPQYIADIAGNGIHSTDWFVYIRCIVAIPKSNLSLSDRVWVSRVILMISKVGVSRPNACVYIRA